MVCFTEPVKIENADRILWGGRPKVYPKSAPSCRDKHLQSLPEIKTKNRTGSEAEHNRFPHPDPVRSCVSPVKRTRNSVPRRSHFPSAAVVIIIAVGGVVGWRSYTHTHTHTRQTETRPFRPYDTSGPFMD